VVLIQTAPPRPAACHQQLTLPWTAAAKARLQDRPGTFFKSDFFEMEAEMSDDEGHSDDGDDDDANADGMLVGCLCAAENHLIGFSHGGAGSAHGNLSPRRRSLVPGCGAMSHSRQGS
jgi:hypothetical protein